MPVNDNIWKRMVKIIARLEKWSYEYYILNQPTVKDQVYDQYFQELKNLEQKYQFIFPNSPTTQIGYRKSNQFRPFLHQIPMLSLDSVNNCEDLIKFDERVKKILKNGADIEYICEWKIDGLSVSLIYQNYQLTQVGTRGNGTVGEEVSFNKYLLKNIPFFLEGVADCEVRGEVYMKKSEFERLNAELKKTDNNLLANPRNAAAGSIRTLTPTQNRNLHFFAYQLFNNHSSTQLACLQQLEKLGFAVSPDYQLRKNIVQVAEFIRQQEKKRDKLDFESDGIVVKINDYSFYQQLGQTSKFPRWAMAYKFPAGVITSQIKSIYTEVSRSGRITYVAEITPVILQGSQINKATLHNYAFIHNLALNVGDEVVIEKAGDIIPQVKQVIKLTNSLPWLPPADCPSCQEELKWNSSNIYQVCLNNNCSQKVINSLTHFASKIGLDIKGVSQKVITKLYQHNLLKKPTDFFQLKEKERELLQLGGVKKKSVDNILRSVENSKKKSLANLLTALGIPLLGLVKAQKLTNFYPDLTSLRTGIENKEWDKIKDILGEETQKALENYCQKAENMNLVKELAKISNFPSDNTKE